MKFTLCLSCILLVCCSVAAQNCHCDFTLEKTTTFLDGAASKIKPGDTVCLMTGHWKNLMMRYIIGTPQQPVVIINCGGQASIGNDDFYYAMVFENSRNFHVTGTGDKNIKYGIRITGTETGSGLSFNSLTTDFEADHIEVSNTGFAGITAKTDPTCEPATWRENFTLRNVSIHHNYIHDTAGEGMYIGNTRYHGTSRVCDGQEKTFLAHFIRNLRVYNNIIENTAWDGMQVSMADEDCEVYNNRISNYGVTKSPSQDAGLVIGGGSTGRFYNNRIIGGSGSGMAVYGMGNNYVYNNLIYNAGGDGIFIQDNETVKPGWCFHILHNNIINTGRDGIRMYSDESTGNEFYNNIIINPATFEEYETFSGISGEDAYIFVLKDRPIDYTKGNNFTDRNVANVLFVDADNFDFRLKTGSPVIDAGMDFPEYGIEFDQMQSPRKTGASADIGMMEYQPGMDEASVVEVYPNPAIDRSVFLKFLVPEIHNLEIDLFTTAGKAISRIDPVPDIDQKVMRLDFAGSKISSGLYMLRVSFNNKRYTCKVVID